MAGGFSLGPLVGGALITWSGGYILMLVVSIVLMVISMLLTYRLQRIPTEDAEPASTPA